MQMKFDLTDTEIVNLKRKIDELDPVAQAEKVVDYLGKNYTQKQLGEKLGKTRDWIAKRVQFIRAVEKLPKSEQEEIKNLVRHHTSSMDVVILVADLPNEQRQQIISKHPKVEEARRMVDELKQHESTEARLRMLERSKSKTYSEIELIFRKQISHLSNIQIVCSSFISSSLNQKIISFIKEKWTDNPKLNPNIMTESVMRCRVMWLSKSEDVKLRELHGYIEECQTLCSKIVGELEDKAVELVIYKAELQSVYAQLRQAHAELESLKGGKHGKSGDLDLFNRIPKDKRQTVYHALCKAFHPDKAHDISEDKKVEQTELLKIITNWWREYQKRAE